jgi:hypothetical protein
MISIIVESTDYHRLGSGQHLLQVAAPRTTPKEILHFPTIPFVKPAIEKRQLCALLHWGHSDQVEAKRPRPILDPVSQLTA